MGLRREGHPLPRGRDRRGRGQLPRPHHHDRRLLDRPRRARAASARSAPASGSCAYGDVEAVRAAITPKTCAVLVEPIQGEGGVIIPPKGYLKGLREICDQNRVLLILDEIQSGLGRTGKLFAFEHEGIRPDGVTIGKALSGGFYPVSAFLAKAEVMDVFTPGIHGSTYGGNPLACAVGIAALDVLVEEKLIERAAELGVHLDARLAGDPLTAREGDPLPGPLGRRRARCPRREAPGSTATPSRTAGSSARTPT